MEFFFPEGTNPTNLYCLHYWVMSYHIDGIHANCEPAVMKMTSFVVGHEDKIAFVGSNGLAKTTLFQILAGEMEPDEGSYKWGITTSQSYFPKDNTKDFDCDDIIVDWLTQYSEIKDPTYVNEDSLEECYLPAKTVLRKLEFYPVVKRLELMLSKLMISRC